MQRLSRDQALEIISTFKRDPDAGIVDSLINLMQLADILSCITTESCEGHIDWLRPYPYIAFTVPYTGEVRHPLWKVWLWRENYINKKQSLNILETIERRITFTVHFLTKELVNHYETHSTNPLMLFSVERTSRTCFMIRPVFVKYSQSLREAGNFNELGTLLEEQRREFASISKILLSSVKRNTGFNGVEYNGCRGCLGKL
ncbi:MAG: hypothetical protein RLZZ308_295 [Candidatus Parcubacteria bacterium]